MYNRDNRLKVARDEAKHAAQEQELQAKHKAAEAESRRKMLLQRAKERRAEVLNSAGLADEAAALGSLSAAAEESDCQDDYAVGLQQEADERRQDSIQQQQQQDQPYRQQPAVGDQQQPVLEHINFWKDLEAKAEHPDRQVRQHIRFSVHHHFHSSSMFCSVLYLYVLPGRFHILVFVTLRQLLR